MLNRKFLLITLLTIFCGLEAISQPQNTQVLLANLRSDVDRLDQIVRRLRMEVESLSRENEELRRWALNRAEADKDQFVTLNQLNQTLKQFETQINSATQASQNRVVAEVSREIETLAEQTQKAINTLAKSMDNQPRVEQVVTFNDNYPKSGTTYTVKRGDSIGKIARENRSQVDWIKNANRLASDIIYPGQELFIPQKD